MSGLFRQFQIALLLLLAAAAQEDETHPQPQIRGILVRATDHELSEKSALDPDLQQRLEQAFEYAHFEVIGDHTEVLSPEHEAWIVPSRELFLKADSKGVAEDGRLHLHLQFWRHEKVVLKTDAALLPDRPLCIAGPRWGEDQLIFVVILLPESA